MVRVLIVEDDPDTSRALCLRLGLESDFELVGVLDSAGGLLSAAIECRPDVVVLDLNMPGPSPVEAALELRAVARRSRVLIWSGLERLDLVTAAWRAGAYGYVGKDAGTPELIRAIRSIAEGGMVFGSAPHP